MKAMLTAFAAIALIAVCANFGLHRAGFSSKDVQAAPSVRLD